jgi:hypothetical protein
MLGNSERHSLKYPNKEELRGGFRSDPSGKGCKCSPCFLLTRQEFNHMLSAGPYALNSDQSSTRGAIRWDVRVKD